MENPHNWQVLESAEAVALQAVSLIMEAAEAAIRVRGAFHLVTAGGTTPLLCYQLLAQKRLPSPEKWHIYVGDERCLPEDDRERNSVALEQTWLAKSDIPQSNRHYIRTEQGTHKAAESYLSIVEDQTFDVVMLGMGEDGHTASIFPNHSYPESAVVVELDSPKMPPERVSLSIDKLSDAKLVIKLITGKSKQIALSQWLESVVLPIAQVEGEETVVLVDKAAFPHSSNSI